MVVVIDDIDDGRLALRQFFSHSRRIVGFTGAGVSTECGIPDFRSPNSPWLQFAPIEFSRFLSHPSIRQEAWRRHFALQDLIGEIKPGRTHYALAAMMRSGKMAAIITQNIDGLHQGAGAPADEVIELHGNATYAQCLSCRRRYELSDIRKQFERDGEAPVCHCGGIVKLATISFGQPMPEREMVRAQTETDACDLFLAMGSSLVVYPAADFPLNASRKGARLIIVNGQETPLDRSADLVLRGDIGTFLEPWANQTA